MSEKTKKVRIFGIDSEPNVYDATVKEEGEGVFRLTSMKKIGEWRKKDEPKEEG